jgi:Tfp pilus assembly protein FimV
VAARVARVERERDELGGRIGTLEAELAEAQRLLQLREAELAVLEQELARIRRTLRP